MSNNNSKILDKLKQFLPFIILPLVMILMISMFVSNNAENKKLKYYDVVQMFIDVFTKNEDGTISIDETMCNGCGLCMNLCKFDAIELVEV